MTEGTLTGGDSDARAARRRVPLWQQLTAVAILLVAVAGYFGYAAMSSAGTPRATAEKFLAALHRGDADAAWQLMSPPTAGREVAASALDRASLEAALKVGRPDLASLTYSSTGSLGEAALVDFSYRVGSAPRRIELALSKDPARKRLLVLDGWAVHIVPVIVDVTVPSYSGGLSVDGRRLEVPTDKPVRIALLPLKHRITLESAGPTTASSVDIDGFSSDEEQRVTFKPELAPSTLAQVQSAVADSYRRCNVSGSVPDDCVTSLPYGRITRWELIGTPTVTSVTYDPDQGWVVVGMYQAIVTDLVYDSEYHKVQAGAFARQVQLTKSTVRLGSGARSQSDPVFPRPATIDEAAAKQLVSAGFRKCAAATATAPPDCPQVDYRPGVPVKDAKWHLNGDPLANAVVSFDAQRGVIQVSGSFDMSFDYTIQGFPYTDRSSTSKYKADLVSTPAGLRLVAIYAG